MKTWDQHHRQRLNEFVYFRSAFSIPDIKESSAAALDRVAALERQRDELLAALQAMAALFDVKGGYRHGADRSPFESARAQESAAAAIANATKGTP